MHKSWLRQKLHKYGKGHESAWKGWGKRWPGDAIVTLWSFEQADIGETKVKMLKKTYKTYKEGLNELGTQLMTQRPRQDLHVKPKADEKAAT